MTTEIITEELVAKIWKTYLDDANATISNCDITPVGDPGDYYSSVMSRANCLVHTNEEQDKKTVVIKTLPKGEAVLKYATNSRIFEKEMDMLANVLPSIRGILSTIGISSPLAAQLYFSQADPVIIAMEDLALGDFYTGNKYIGLCLEECLQVVRHLAEFHAGSMVYLENNPNALNLYDKYIWGSQNRDSIDVNLNSALTTIINHIDSWSSEKWAEKLKKLQNNHYPQVLYDSIEKTNRKPLVLNHGDLRNNNIMFRHTSPTSPELRFVDFQLTWISAPVFDLLYFIFTSTRSYVRFNNMETILRAYYERFIHVCAELKIDTSYTFENLIKDFNDNLIFGFAMFQYVFPVVTAPANKELENAKEGDDYMAENPAYFNPNFQKIFLQGLPFFEKHGLFQ